jgi:hypothetical protein
MDNLFLLLGNDLLALPVKSLDVEQLLVCLDVVLDVPLDVLLAMPLTPEAEAKMLEILRVGSAQVASIRRREAGRLN